ncbi:phosphoesterase [Burkholderia sp. A27]|jgi:undecaprenyl-diphosphatase|nr:phosphoesterase [Burkholderia sp. A27]
MNSFDTAVQVFLTQHAFQSATINHIIRVIAGQASFKGFVLVPVLWWMWFGRSERTGWKREMIIATVASGLASLAAGRLLAASLPFRERPLYDPDLHLNFPSVGLQDAIVRTWSSFPSDHAMLWTAIATGIFLINRRVGTLALLYTAVFICLPRVYLGLHYPTDVLAGMALGMVSTYLATRDAVRVRFAAPILQRMQMFPAPGYTFAFLLSFELITQFDDLLLFVHAGLKVL